MPFFLIRASIHRFVGDPAGPARTDNRRVTSPFRPTRDYVPPRWLAGPHRQILMTERLNAAYVPTPSEEIELALPSGGTCRLVRRRAVGESRGVVVVVHGLGGDARAGRIAECARVLNAAGLDAVAVGLRGAGGTTPQPRLYHAADLDEIDAAARHPWTAGRPRVMLALSLGANLALRHAAMRGHDVASRFDAAVVVCPAAHLPASARALAGWPCALYNAKFAAALGARVRAVAPASGVRPHDRWRHRTVRRYDADFAAPAAGYASPDAYYEGASAHRVVGDIEIPTLVFGTADDPIVPVDVLREMWRAHPTVDLRISAHGSHLGFVEATPSGLAAGWMPRIVEAIDDLFPRSAPGDSTRGGTR